MVEAREARCVREIHDVNEYMRSFVGACAVVWCTREARGASTSSLEDDSFVARRRRKSSRSTASFVRCVCSTASHARFFVSSFVRSFVDASWIGSVEIF